MNKKSVFLFWAAMDFLYVLGFLYFNLSRGRIPLYDDVLSFAQVNLQFGENLLTLFFVGSMLLTISIPVTMWMLFRQHPWARFVAYVQVPFRLCFSVPSLSFIPWVISLFQLKQALIMIFILFVSEILKVISLYKVDVRQKEGR
ncbi:hypothetical protein [Pseudomonas sp. MWU12-2037]|uniref:hypothetical protein n=1 Tax=Pseudomonas sp. MWU12-2037 TaxID=2928690 RepID=UPI00200C6458|nr:hypothetical protein [Pseudomonas sp. MWU12-2037]